MKTMRPALLAFVAVAALPLAGCFSLSPKPPARLLTLTPDRPIAAGATRTGGDAQAIAVAVPTVLPALSTPRVMVSDGPNGIAYLKDQLWAGPPALLFRTLLAETITTATGRIVPESRNGALQPDTRLTGQLTAFGLDTPSSSALVVFDATLSRPGREQVEARRFEARIPVATQDGPAVSAGVNRAANQVAGEVAAWVGGGR
jgi:cholesterol transport system auxiliary component